MSKLKHFRNAEGNSKSKQMLTKRLNRFTGGQKLVPFSTFEACLSKPFLCFSKFCSCLKQSERKINFFLSILSSNCRGMEEV